MYLVKGIFLLNHQMTEKSFLGRSGDINKYAFQL